MLGTFAMVTASSIHQASELASTVTAGSAARTKSKVGSVERQVRVLEANLAKSMMINEALWELIRDKHGLTEKDLHDKLYEVDMRDGVLDGKHQRKAEQCPNCGHTVSPRHPACIYCGQVIDESVFAIN
jgi:ribosomal protein S27AE